MGVPNNIEPCLLQSYLLPNALWIFIDEMDMRNDAKLYEHIVIVLEQRERPSFLGSWDTEFTGTFTEKVLFGLSDRYRRR